jgi:hypothetical protein
VTSVASQHIPTAPSQGRGPPAACRPAHRRPFTPRRALHLTHRRVTSWVCRRGLSVADLRRWHRSVGILIHGDALPTAQAPRQGSRQRPPAAATPPDTSGCPWTTPTAAASPSHTSPDSAQTPAPPARIAEPDAPHWRSRGLSDSYRWRTCRHLHTPPTSQPGSSSFGWQVAWRARFVGGGRVDEWDSSTGVMRPGGSPITVLRPEPFATRSLPRGETPVPSSWRATNLAIRLRAAPCQRRPSRAPGLRRCGRPGDTPWADRKGRSKRESC